MKKFSIDKIIITAMILMASSAQTLAETTAEPLALQKIMSDMGKNMQVIADGISREDWKLVANTAPLIANHPQPPMMEKVKIMTFMGTDMGTFKGYDGKTHQAAQLLGETAATGNGQAVIADFATLQNTCLACHQQFRKPFQEHFYGNN